VQNNEQNRQCTIARNQTATYRAHRATQRQQVNDMLQKEIKKVISALITQNITLKRENAQLKAEKSSKS